MYNLQANSARFIYTLSYLPPESNKTNNVSPDGNMNASNIDLNNKKNNNSKQINITNNIQDIEPIEGVNNEDDANGNDNNNAFNSQRALQQSNHQQQQQQQQQLLPRASNSSKPSISNLTKPIIYPYCHLKNNGYLTKVSRSDEKIRYTETDMYAIVRTVLFMYCYKISPNESLDTIITTGELSYTDTNIPNHTQMLDLKTAIELLDSLFGDNFSNVVSRVVIKCINEYKYIWRLYPYASKIVFPSASDFIKLARFVNVSTFAHSKITQFILNNSMDNKIPLQSNVKILK